MDSALDVPIVEDPRQYMSEVARTWESFMLSGSLSDAQVRRTILTSWGRCRERGVDPLSFKAPTAPVDTAALDPDLLVTARATVQNLSSNLQQTRHLIALCDDRGRIFEVGGDRDVIMAAVRVNIDRGGVWAEELVGTNGIGTSLQEGRPVQVFATEHFCCGWQDWTCSAAPIRSPAGQIIAGVNISSYSAPVHPHTLELTASVAREIEKELHLRFGIRRSALREALIRFESAYPHAALVAVDRSGSVVASARTGRRWSHLDGPDGRWEGLLSNLITNRRRVEQELTLTDGRTIGSEWHPIVLAQEVVGMVGVLNLPASTQPMRKVADKGWAAWEGAPVRSRPMKELLALARKLAETDLSALILGETGTGKEMVSRAIHRGSNRASGPFIAINCGALAPELVTSELFGYAPGAFTGAARAGNPGKFELAHGGTLMLDEVGDLPFHAQTALLRVLDTGEVTRVGNGTPRRVDVRVIAATNRDLAAAVGAGRFREDLYHRLNTVELVVPPLRERPEDIAELVAFFLAQIKGCSVKLSPEAMALLRRHHWPGNVRQLRNTILRAHLTQVGDLIRPEDLHLRPAPPGTGPTGAFDESKRKAILEAVERASGNVARAARELGVSRGTVYRYLHEAQSRT